MMKARILSSAVCILLAHQPAFAQNRELRGVWVNPREAGTTSFWSKQQIAAAMDSIAAANFNTVYFNGWARGFPLWQSEVFERHTGFRTDPMLVDSVLGSRDLMQEAIAEAHRVGLEIEAWMEYGFVGWWSGYTPGGTSAVGPLFDAHPDWHGRDTSGNNRVSIGSLGYFYWMSHNHPDVCRFLVELHQELAKRYDLDGIELDRIRYPNLNWGYDSVSVQLYRADHEGSGPPRNYNDAAWMRWRADRLNEFHRDAYDSLKAANPSVLVTNAPSHYGTGSSYPAYESFLQDWKSWVNNGSVDAVQVQMYAAPQLFGEYLASALQGIQDTAKVTAGIAAVANGVTRTPAEIVQLVSLTRTAGVPGHSFWYYNDLRDLGYLSLLRENVYQQKAHSPYRPDGWRMGGLFFDESFTVRTSGWKLQAYFQARGGVFLYADSVQPQTLTYEAEVPVDAWYEVYVYLLQGSSAFTRSATYRIFRAGNPSDRVVVDQSLPSNAGWHKIGDVFLQAGARQSVFELSNAGIGAGKIVVADDVMLLLNRRLSPGAVVGVHERSTDASPERPMLAQNYPNPFNPSTVVEYRLPRAGHVRLDVYDTLGRKIAELVDGEQSAGAHRVPFSAVGLSSGLYFCRLESGGFAETRKMLLLH